MIDCDATYTLEYNFEPQSAGTGQTQLANIAVTAGQPVTQGDVIGRLYVANALAHVHFAIMKNWVNSCPEQYLEPAARASISNLVNARFPGASMCNGGDVSPPSLVTPYANELDMASVNEAFSSAGSTSPWGFAHDGIDFFPSGNLKPFRAACSGVVDPAQLRQNNVTSNWQVNLLIKCNPYVPDPNLGGYFSPIAVEYIFEPMSTVQTVGQTQLNNITVANGQAVSQGDVIGYLLTAGAGAHVHFGVIPFGAMLANGVPRIPSCPEPHFSNIAAAYVLTLLRVVWPGAAMCYSGAPAVTLSSVKSRKTHGAAGSFDLIIDTSLIAPSVTVEPRAIGGGHTIVFQFNGPITQVGNATVTPVGTASAATSGNDVVVTLTEVPDNRRVTVSVNNVNGATTVQASIGFSVGDVNNSRSVNSSDISSVKARSGQATSAANFKFDVNASGSIGAADISAMKARFGLVLP